MSTFRFFPASYYDSFVTEAEVLNKLPVPPQDMTITTLTCGAKLYQSGIVAAILAQEKNGYALWLSGSDMARETMEQAIGDVQEFEAVRGPGGWKIFEIPA